MRDAPDELDFDRGAFDEALDFGDYDAAARLLDELAARVGADDPELLYERAVLDWERAGPEAAIAILDRLLGLDPEFADAHYLRARASEDLGDLESMVRHDLETLRLDALADPNPEGPDEASLDFIETTAETVLASIPDEFIDELRDVPIVLEPRPHVELVREGFDPRALGLFEGLEQGRLAAGDAAHAPTRIVLFYANLLADFPDEEHLAEEIEVTLLHEIGHFFGLDEDDVERLGLE